MKRVTLEAKILVADDFEPGDCSKCPLHSESYFDNHMATSVDIDCKVGFKDYNCPIKGGS